MHIPCDAVAVSSQIRSRGAAWIYICSALSQGVSIQEGRRTKTKPTKFKSGDELIDLWRQFCDEIVADGYKVIPSQTSFCRWLAVNYEKTDRKTIYNSLNKIFPEIKKEFDRIRGDVIAEGAMLGHYQPTMSIFALKHWCSWRDTPETETRGEVRIVDDI